MITIFGSFRHENYEPWKITEKDELDTKQSLIIYKTTANFGNPFLKTS